MGDDNGEGSSSRLLAKRYFIIAALLTIAGLLLLMDLIQLRQVRLIFGALPRFYT